MGKIHLGSCFNEEVSCSFVIFMLCSVDLGRLWVFFKVSKKIIRKKIYIRFCMALCTWDISRKDHVSMGMCLKLYSHQGGWRPHGLHNLFQPSLPMTPEFCVYFSVNTTSCHICLGSFISEVAIAQVPLSFQSTYKLCHHPPRKRCWVVLL